MALLDSHPELLVLPEETAYFPTVLTKYAPRGRQAQFDHLTKQSPSNVLLPRPSKRAKPTHSTLPRHTLSATPHRPASPPAHPPHPPPPLTPHPPPPPP